MNNKQVRKNIFFSLAYQLTTVAFGLMIPNLILKTYGTSVHGLISTLNNLMNYIMLLNAGLATASIQSLYKPLSEKDFFSVNSTLNTIRKYYILTAVFMIFSIVGIAVVLPFIIRGEVSNVVVIILMLVMGLQYVLENILFSTERSLLQADNKLFIVSQVNSISYIIRVILQVILIRLKCSIIVIMLIPVLLVVFRGILFKLYIKANYAYIDINIKVDEKRLSKRKNALVHQLSGLVLNNTDVILLSIFWNQTVVSKYSVYSLVFAYLYLLLSQVFSSSLVASFGKKLINENSDSIRNDFNKVSFFCRYSTTIIYATTTVMILPFVFLYTYDVVGTDYVDALVGMLFVIYGVLNALRIPYLMLVDAAGLYRETQHQALIEMSINLSLSLLLVGEFGILGVLIGTIVSFAYRTTATVIFADRVILKTSSWTDLSKMMIVFVVVLGVLFINRYLPAIALKNWISWILMSIRTMGIAICITTILSFFTDNSYFKRLFSLVRK